jgi:hypothetical protein
MQVVVQKVDLSVTNNGTIKANVYPEGSDINNVAESIEIIGDECIYLATRKKGETITVETKGKWKNVVIEKAYQEALNSPAYDRFKLLFKRSVAGMNKIANGDRTQIDLETAKVLMQDNLEIFIKAQNFTLEALKELDTVFTKQILADIKSKDIETQYKAWQVINDLTSKNIGNVSKEYRINNNGEEPKTKTIKKN